MTQLLNLCDEISHQFMLRNFNFDKQSCYLANKYREIIQEKKAEAELSQAMTPPIEFYKTSTMKDFKFKLHRLNNEKLMGDKDK